MNGEWRKEWKGFLNHIRNIQLFAHKLNKSLKLSEKEDSGKLIEEIILSNCGFFVYLNKRRKPETVDCVRPPQRGRKAISGEKSGIFREGDDGNWA